MKRAFAFSLILALLVSALAGALWVKLTAAASGGQTENTWETRNPMPTARSGLGAVAVNGKIYAIGGATEWDSYVGTNEVYDPATNSWETKQPMPEPKANFGIAVYENKIYCIGGSQSMGYNGPEPTGLTMAYDTQTNMWRTLTAMPTPRNYLCANVVDGKIYLIGGSIKEPENPPFYSVNLNEVYDIATDSWSTRKPIPMAVQRYVSAVVDGKIYIIGGYDPQRSSSEVLTQVYNPATDSWSTGAAAPNKMGDAAGATTGVYAPEKNLHPRRH
jgi:N-acetylneuraminic acid mutarotase